MFDLRVIVIGGNSSSHQLFSQDDVQESWWMNLRLEVLRVQPPPTLKSSSTLLNQNHLLSLEENKEKMLE